MLRQIVVMVLVMGFVPLMAGTGLTKNLERFELNGGIGISSYKGDIGSTISHPGESFNLGARYYFSPRNSFKFNVCHMSLKGDDIYNSENINRGYSFITPLTELSGQMDFFLFKSPKNIGRPGYRGKMHKWNLYLNYGFGYAFFNPSTDIPEDVHSNYKKSELIIPTGCGIRLFINRSWNVDLEYSKRFTTTDFLDGYGNLATGDDRYSLFSVNVGYRLSR